MKTPWWDKAEFASRRQGLVMRARVITALREYFAEQGFLEVETPILQRSPGLDRHVQPLATEVRSPFEARGQRRYLHTSPEFSMKKLLAAGESRIFQICHVFRDGEDSAHHTPEFTLLEWYRADADYTALMTDVEELLQRAAAVAEASHFVQGALRCDAKANWTRQTVADAFNAYAGIDLLSTLGEGFDPSADRLRDAAASAGVQCRDDQTWDDIFHRVLIERIEPEMAKRGPHFLCDYPVVVGALARNKPNQPALCERVEAYICGLELANGFSELTDAHEQRQRFERDRALYKSLYGSPPPIDEDFLAALDAIPPAAGMALGVDRLVMLVTGATHIHDVQWAPVEMNEP